MNEHRGSNTDRNALSELFGAEPLKIKQIVDTYLVPRERRMVGSIDRNRGHWLTPTAISMGEAARAIVEKKLDSLARGSKKNMVGHSVAAVYCGVSEQVVDQRALAIARRKYPKEKLNGAGAKEFLARDGLTELRDTTAEEKKKHVARTAPVSKRSQRAGNPNRRMWRMDFVEEIKNEGKTVRQSPIPSDYPSGTMVIPFDMAQAMTNKTIKVVDHRGRVVGDYAFTKLPHDQLIGFLSNGGGFEAMTIFESLRRPWVNLRERNFWQQGWSLLVERANAEVAAGMDRSLAERAADDAVLLADALPKARPRSSGKIRI